MEIVVWIVMQLALFGGLLWFVSARRDREMGVARRAAPKGETRELHELRAQRARALNMPLTELARPASMEDIVGQADGIRALCAAKTRSMCCCTARRAWEKPARHALCWRRPSETRNPHLTRNLRLSKWMLPVCVSTNAQLQTR